MMDHTDRERIDDEMRKRHDASPAGEWTKFGDGVWAGRYIGMGLRLVLFSERGRNATVFLNDGEQFRVPASAAE